MLGTTRPTLLKWLKAGVFPNAFQTPKGKRLDWEIPLSDLQSSGKLQHSPDTLRPAAKASPKEMAELRDQAQFTEIANLEAQVKSLQTELVTVKGERDTLAGELKAVRETRDQLMNRFLGSIETKAVQEKRRFSWFGLR